MFDGNDRVQAANFLCRQCRGQHFLLYDRSGEGHAGAIELRCAGCKSAEARVVTPSLRDELDTEPVPEPPLSEPTQLWCDNRPVKVTKHTPKGVCWGVVFVVIERGNELLSRCSRCGKGDSLGMINAALQ